MVDGGELRRGKPAANVLWGNKRAILVGDFFYARASSMVVEDGDLAILEVFANGRQCITQASGACWSCRR